MKSFKEIYSITMTSDYGVGLKNVFASNATMYKLNLLGQYEYQQGNTDYRTILSKIINKNAAIIIVGYGAELGTIVKQARELGIKNQFFSTVNFYDQNTIRSGGTAVDGVIFSALVLNVSSGEKIISDYVAKYRSKFNEEPDIWSALGYDCFNIINNATSDSLGEIKIDGIKNKLYSLRNYPGVSGNTTFDKNGDVVKPINFMTVSKGNFILIK